MRRSALDRPKYDEYHHGRSEPPYLAYRIRKCLSEKERHYGDGLGAATPSPNGHKRCHAAGETTTTSPPTAEVGGNAAERAAHAWEQLARNPYLVSCERHVLPALIALAGYRMGDTLPDRVHIGFIKPEMRTASGVCRRYWEAALPRLVEAGVLSRTRHPSAKNPGSRWYSYTLLGSALNGQLQTIGQGRTRSRSLAAKKRPPVWRPAPDGSLDAAERHELEQLRRENAELRTWKQRHERCWLCKQPLSGNDHAHAACRPAAG